METRLGSAEEKIQETLDRASSRVLDAQQQVDALVHTASDIAAETQQGLHRSTAAFEEMKQDVRMKRSVFPGVAYQKISSTHSRPSGARITL